MREQMLACTLYLLIPASFTLLCRHKSFGKLQSLLYLSKYFLVLILDFLSTLLIRSKLVFLQ